MFRNIIKKTYSTLKSRNDEQANQALLGRLKHVPVMKEKKIVVEGNQQVKQDDSLRHFTFVRMDKLVKLYTSDPLIWDSSTLCRIFKLPQDVCHNLVLYTKPFAYVTTREMDETQKVLKNPIVIDLARAKADKKYLRQYQKLAFIEDEKPYERRALE